MPAPTIFFEVSRKYNPTFAFPFESRQDLPLEFGVSDGRNYISKVNGFDSLHVKFYSDIPYVAFECRGTRVGADWGLGKGSLLASFSSTPAYILREFDIFERDLIEGSTEYRISLFAQSQDGGWNDNYLLIPAGSSGFKTLDGKVLLCMR